MRESKCANKSNKNPPSLEAQKPINVAERLTVSDGDDQCPQTCRLQADDTVLIICLEDIRVSLDILEGEHLFLLPVCHINCAELHPCAYKLH
ncbi:hypothetical protein J6590_060047 [Homalodisca vitripennis]|nr:hypothetical protein J6590_060047 [Homalodisca vitripennis]